jgi:hypothetical protein
LHPRRNGAPSFPTLKADMTVIDKPPERASFGQCPRNPVGDEHEFVDMGILLGPRRWRCKYCYGGQGELLLEGGRGPHPVRP